MWTRWITSFKSTTSPFHTYFGGQNKGTSLPGHLSLLSSRSNIVDGCPFLRMGSPPRGSRCVGEMVSGGTVITYKSVGTQCSTECTSSFQRQCQTQTDPIDDRQFNSRFLHQSRGRDKICSPVRNDMEDSTLVSPLGVQLQAAHIPRKKNTIANQLSRGRQIKKMTEWSLNQHVVPQIFRVYSTPNIDLFATRENRKLTVFCSPFPDPLACGCDALVVEICLHIHFRRQY